MSKWDFTIKLTEFDDNKNDMAMIIKYYAVFIGYQS